MHADVSELWPKKKKKVKKNIIFIKKKKKTQEGLISDKEKLKKIDMHLINWRLLGKSFAWNWNNTQFRW